MADFGHIAIVAAIFVGWNPAIVGQARYLTTDGEIDEGYRSISITDPGNAPSAITVGATHRSDPHGFGISYFSSRGPTGDGPTSKRRSRAG